jgi:hypothetical protein
VYIKIRIGSKAYNYLSPYLEVERDAGRNPTSKEVLKFLENVFKDLDCRIKAQQELKGLKMPYLGDFNDFQSNFVRLANILRMPQDQWKEELHDKLYDNLHVQMEVKIADEDCSFHAYCKTAQQYARGLKQTGKERSDRRAA